MIAIYVDQEGLVKVELLSVAGEYGAAHALWERIREVVENLGETIQRSGNGAAAAEVAADAKKHKQ